MHGIKADCTIRCCLGMETPLRYLRKWEFSSPIKLAARTVSDDILWRKSHTMIQFSTQKVHRGYCACCDCWRFLYWIPCDFERERERECVLVCAHILGPDLMFLSVILSFLNTSFLVQYYWWFRNFILFQVKTECFPITSPGFDLCLKVMLGGIA
jgi:hypothetical protein